MQANKLMNEERMASMHRRAGVGRASLRVIAPEPNRTMLSGGRFMAAWTLF